MVNQNDPNRAEKYAAQLAATRSIGASQVAHPSHYNQGKIEVIEFLEDQKLGFHLGNCVKYVARAGKKHPEKLIEDLEKAIWYLKRFIEIQKENPRRPNDMNPREIGEKNTYSFNELRLAVTIANDHPSLKVETIMETVMTEIIALRQGRG